MCPLFPSAVSSTTVTSPLFLLDRLERLEDAFDLVGTSSSLTECPRPAFSSSKAPALSSLSSEEPGLLLNSSGGYFRLRRATMHVLIAMRSNSTPIPAPMPTLAHNPKAPPFPSEEDWSAFAEGEGEEVDVPVGVIEVDLEVAVGVIKAFIGSVCKDDRSEDAHRI
jgi:hypothetical protein